MTIATSKKTSPDWPVIGFMAFLHIGALFALLPSNFSWSAVGLAVFLHWVTGGLGITLRISPSRYAPQFSNTQMARVFSSYLWHPVL